MLPVDVDPQCNKACNKACNKVCNKRCSKGCNKACNAYFTFCVTLHVTRKQNDPLYFFRQYNIMFNVVSVILPKTSVLVKKGFSR